MLITSCKDNICRLWIETVLPDNGLINLAQLDPQGADPKFRTNRHKHRFLQRLKHIKYIFIYFIQSNNPKIFFLKFFC